jgi:hypothetical protein
VVVHPQVRLASGGSHGHSDVMDATSSRMPTAATHTPLLAALQQLIRLAISCANLLPVSLPRKETGASHTAAALLAWGFAAFPLVTIAECSLATAMPMMVPQPKEWTAPD